MKYIKNFENSRYYELKNKLIDEIYFGGHQIFELLNIFKNEKFDINFYDTNGDTPLLVATYHNRIDVINRLIELGANIDIQDKYTKETALFIAAENNNYNILEILINNGANWNIKNINGHDFIDNMYDETFDMMIDDYPKEYEDYLIKIEAEEKYNL